MNNYRCIVKRNIDEVKLHRSRTFSRVIKVPFKYLLVYTVRFFHFLAILNRLKVRVDLLCKRSFVIDLPSHIDIFLNGCKMGESDFLLQDYLIDVIDSDTIFFDVGSSIGYYSVLASTLIEGRGKVYAIEPSKTVFDILLLNTRDSNITAINIAIGDDDRECVLYEFPTRYNEYNTLVVDDFLMKKRISKKQKSVKEIVVMRSLDSLTNELCVVPNLLKVDIEGSEIMMIKGMRNLLLSCPPKLILRFWPNYRDNSRQVEVFKLLIAYGYSMYSIKDKRKMRFVDLSMYSFEYIIFKK